MAKGNFPRSALALLLFGSLHAQDASSLRGTIINNPLAPLDKQGLGWNTTGNRGWQPFSYALQSGGSNYCAPAGGSTTTYTCNLTPAISAYTAGFVVAMKPDVNNTASSTLNINSLGAKTIQKLVSGTLTNLSSGELDSDAIYLLRYNGTVFVVDPGSTSSSTNYVCAPAGASTTAYTCSPSPALSSYTAGTLVVFTPDVSNSGAATVNVSTLGAKNIQKINQGALAAVVANDMVAGTTYILRYNGTVFVVDLQAGSACNVTTTYSATPTFNVPAGCLSTTFNITLTGNVTSSTLQGAGATALVAGSAVSFRICQDGTGSRTLVFPSNVVGFATIESTLSSCTTQSGEVNASLDVTPTGPALITNVGGGVGQFITGIAGTAPVNPPSGSVRIYMSSVTNTPHSLSSSGTDTDLAGGGTYGGSAVCGAGTTTTSNSPTALATITYASGLTAGDMLRITTFWTHSGGTTDTPRMRVDLGGSNIDSIGNVAWAAAGDTNAAYDANIHVIDSTHQRVQGGYYRNASWQGGANWGVVNGSLGVTVNTSVSLVIYGYFTTGGSGEVVSLDHYCVERVKQ